MTTSTSNDERDIYQLDKLMEETRSLAAKYRAATGQTLPVSQDLACYDAMRLLGLSEPATAEVGVDAVKNTDSEPVKYLIKGRVQFSDVKTKQPRIGQLNLSADWRVVVLVIMNDDYQPTTLLSCERELITEALGDKPVNKRGAMTVAQFRKLADTIWQTDTEYSE